MFTGPPKQGVDNWSRLHTKLVSVCPDFNKDSEACRKKWGAVYKDYKYDKHQNSLSGNERSEKCKWFILVDEYMAERANVVSHAHGCAHIPEEITPVEGPGEVKIDPGTKVADIKDKSGEQRKEDALLAECLQEVKSSGELLLETVQATKAAKLELFKSMQETMAKLMEKI